MRDDVWPYVNSLGVNYWSDVEYFTFFGEYGADEHENAVVVGVEIDTCRVCFSEPECYMLRAMMRCDSPSCAAAHQTQYLP